MKPLALLLLLTVGAWGQDTLLTSKWGTLKLTPEEYVPRVLAKINDDGTTEWGNMKFGDHPSGVPLLVLVAAWDAYAKECYADSTMTGYSFTWRRGNMRAVDSTLSTNVSHLADYRLSDYVRGRDIYTHRTPTFPGFIEWLRRNK